ncbi:MAG: DoxX family protein [Rhodococcus sp. (in: high G+C Gram-positive bacteria)]
MFIATIVLTVLLAIVLVGSAAGKLTRQDAVVRSLTTVGVPANRFPILAYLEIAGAAGILIGLFWWPLGVLAGACVVLYFVGAVAAHLRVKDNQLAAPAVIAVVAVAAVVLRVVTA